VAPFEILSEIDNFGVERKCKEDLLLEASVNLLDSEAILRDFKCKFDLLYFVLQLVDC
jgi:hypothetical protein